MTREYLKISLRSIFKKKGYSLLNVLGLTIGMCCCLLIFHYVSYEKSYDQFEPHADNIVRIRLDSYEHGTLAYKSATSYPAIGPAMKRDFPEVQSFCRLIDNNLLLSNDSLDRRFSEDKGYYADPAAVDIFGLKMIRGNPKTALNGPDKILLSETMARKYFGQQAALGRTLVNRQGSVVEKFEVTGVFKDFPDNSHLKMNYLISYATLAKEELLSGDTDNATETSWGWYDFYVYLQLKPTVDYKNLEAKLPDFTNKYINSDPWRKANNRRVELHLIPLRDIHLYSNYNQEAEVNGSGQGVSFLFLIAIAIICIAWMNYINLATARSVERAKEVGIRKVLGAVRGKLMRQFLMESFLINMTALLISLILFFLLLRPFDLFTGRAHYTGIILSGNYTLIFIALFLAGTFLSGLYPAFVLSAFKPVLVLKGAFKNSARGVRLRKGLIVTQFVISVILIAGTIVVFKQVSYMRNQRLGANIDQTMVLTAPQTVKGTASYQNAYQPFKSSVLQLRAVKNITASTDVPGNEIYWTNGSKRLGADKSVVSLYNLGVDCDFIPSYDIKMIAGRNFSPTFGTDSSGVLLNQAATKILGFKDGTEAIGEKIIRGDTLTIVGVTADFHQVGLQKSIDPIIMVLSPDRANYYSVKVNPADMEQTIQKLSALWSKYFPQDPFDYYFLDEKFAAQYKSDVQFGTVFGIFAVLAIFIACFGLLGLSAYNVLQRTKEIGIRKVLGASLTNIFVLLSRDFIQLVIISLMLAIPISWFLMNHWLLSYAYRIYTSWWIFAMAGVITLVVAVITISVQILKAVARNPVQSLERD